MFCPNCGTNLPDGTPVCTTCGYQQKKSQQPVQEPVQEPAPQQPAYQEPVQQPAYQEPAQQPAYQPQPAAQPAYQPQYQQPVYQQPQYQPPMPPARPIPVSKKEYLKSKAPESVKKTAGFVTITMLLTLVLVITSAIVPLFTSVFEIPAVSTAFSLIDDEDADPEKLMDELEDSYREYKAEYKYEKEFMTKSQREDAERALEMAEKLLDSFNVLNLKAAADLALDVSGDYNFLNMNEEEAEQASMIMTVLMIGMVAFFFLPLLLTLLAGLNKSAGLTVAALIFTAISQFALCGIVFVVISLVLFIAQAVICGKVNKAYQDYRTGRFPA